MVSTFQLTRSARLSLTHQKLTKDAKRIARLVYAQAPPHRRAAGRPQFHSPDPEKAVTESDPIDGSNPIDKVAVGPPFERKPASYARYRRIDKRSTRSTNLFADREATTARNGRAFERCAGAARPFSGIRLTSTNGQRRGSALHCTHRVFSVMRHPRLQDLRRPPQGRQLGDFARPRPTAPGQRFEI